MNDSQLRTMLTIIIAGGLMVGLIVLIFPIAFGSPNTSEIGAYTELLKNYGSLFSGILGAILGFFFRGKS
jgi:hypothetical protein